MKDSESQSQQSVHFVSEFDQLKKTLQKTGQTSEEDLCFVTSQNARSYLKNLSEDKQQVVNLKDIFKDIDEKLVDILERLLQINPYFRPSASELIKNPIFDDIRCVQLE